MLLPLLSTGNWHLGAMKMIVETLAVKQGVESRVSETWPREWCRVMSWGFEVQWTIDDYADVP
jgi:hypothetical protein